MHKNKVLFCFAKYAANCCNGVVTLTDGSKGCEKMFTLRWEWQCLVPGDAIWGDTLWQVKMNAIQRCILYINDTSPLRRHLNEPKLPPRLKKKRKILLSEMCAYRESETSTNFPLLALSPPFQWIFFFDSFTLFKARFYSCSLAMVVQQANPICIETFNSRNAFYCFYSCLSLAMLATNQPTLGRNK